MTATVPENTTNAPKLDMLWLEITTKCQLNCVHCYNNSSPEGTHGDMPLSDWTAVIDDAARAEIMHIQFIGGEATMHPDLVDLIHYAVDAGIPHIEIYSNLVHVTPDQWEAFSLPSVTLGTSWYSDDPQEHARITQRPTHGRTLANIEEARRWGIPVRAAVPQVFDEQRTGPGRDMLVNLGIPRIGTEDLRGLGRAAGACGGKDARELCGGCGQGGMAVLSDGTVTPCTLSRWLAIADVRSDSLPAIYHSDAMRTAAQDIADVTFKAKGFCQPRHCDPSACGPTP